ncbi:MAG: hypothetical protein SFX72_19595 [Isosphaeraceae bacterium]|nr:hypothetical protein [Isosphaeraceae bacterium]
MDSAIPPSDSSRAPVKVIIETVISPFHCLYLDALSLHTKSQEEVERSIAQSSRYARAALLAYVGAAEALVHQAAVELARPELAAIAADPLRPMPLAEVWRVLPALLAEKPLPVGPNHQDQPPWPQFAELLELRNSWAYPGRPSDRLAYYCSTDETNAFVPLQPHQIPAGSPISADRLAFPRTGLPRDPYALRPAHLDTVRGVLDAAIEALDRRVAGKITRDKRLHLEPVRQVHPSLSPAEGV